MWLSNFLLTFRFNKFKVTIKLNWFVYNLLIQFYYYCHGWNSWKFMMGDGYNLRTFSVDFQYAFFLNTLFFLHILRRSLKHSVPHYNISIISYYVIIVDRAVAMQCMFYWLKRGACIWNYCARHVRFFCSPPILYKCQRIIF